MLVSPRGLPKRPFVKICFGPFMLDLDTRQLTLAGREIHLEPKAFALLATLVLDRPKALSKADLLQRLWRDTVVEEANLSNLVAGIPAALRDNARAPVYVRTMHGFGYAFCGDAIVPAGRPEPEAERPTCWLEWETQRFPLSIGEHVIGRDPDVDIRLEGSTVSRRHARLVVKPQGTVLEDFGSKNGTFRGSERVSGAIQLADGDAIYIGALLVTFHLRAEAMSTDTHARPAR